MSTPKVRRCKRCNHEWEQRHPRAGKPLQCPRCKSSKWDEVIKYGDEEEQGQDKKPPQAAGMPVAAVATR
jgi:hypothetical protein